jgi:hypothetical protein
MIYPSIRIEGSMLAPDILEKLDFGTRSASNRFRRGVGWCVFYATAHACSDLRTRGLEIIAVPAMNALPVPNHLVAFTKKGAVNSYPGTIIAMPM